MATAKILGPTGRPLSVVAPRPRGVVRARYDAAETTAENARHWSMADGLSARAANAPEVRRRLRERARYEVANNSYARGVILTLANDTIGTGPRLQVQADDLNLSRLINREFEDWTAAIGLAEKLRTLRMARAVDGEGFGILVSNPRVNHVVQLDIRLFEADQFATPYASPLDEESIDGLRIDRHGNPIEYHLLHNHPGDLISWNLPGDYDRIPADLVLHWFRADRPCQYRGIPDITPALPLFAQLRRFTLAVLAAAETAADFAAVLYSDLAPDGEAPDGEPFETLEITRRMMTTLPAGWKMGQFRAEQPATTYEMFKREILNEIARCLNMPYNVAAGNSSSYNYASGRLDHQVYFKSLDVDRYHLETAILDRVFRAWLTEYGLATGHQVIPRDWPTPRHQWFWDGREHVDPVKEANAEKTRLASGTTTLADAWARQGHDWRERLQQRAEELALMRELGIPTSGASPQSQDGGADDGETDESDA